MIAQMVFPDFVNGAETYKNFLTLSKKHPQILDRNFVLNSIFGCFPNAIWNGGGHYFHPNAFYLKKEICELINFYNENGIPVRFTFTNPLITEEMCYDTYCNMIAECGHNGFNEILTSSEILEDYLRNKFPNYKYIKSIIGTEEKPIFLDEKYHMSVIRRKIN